jgi:hypothetical protein
VNDRYVGGSDDLTESQEHDFPGADTDAVPFLDELAPYSRPGSRQRAGLSDKTMPAQCKARRKVPFQGVMAQRCLCSKGRASHTVLHIPVSESNAASVLHGGRAGGQDVGTQAVAEARLELPTLEIQIPCQRESVQPGKGGAACAAEEADASPFAFLSGNVKRGKQGSGASF